MVEIRDAQPGDAHDIATVLVESWQVAYHGLLPNSILASLSSMIGGAQLHTAAMDRLRALGFTHATLWVLEGNERAIGFYHRHGWAADGTRRVDQGPGGIKLNELRFRRTLPPV